MGAGRADISPAWGPAARRMAMGFSGELGGSIGRGSIDRSVVHGSVQVERHVSKPCEGSTGDTVEWWGKAQCRPPAMRQRDATGERSVSLAKMVLYYNTHLAEHVNSDFWNPFISSDGVIDPAAFAILYTQELDFLTLISMINESL